MSDRPDPAAEMQRLYDEAERGTAAALERLVSRDAFGEILAKSAENVLAVQKLGSDLADMVVRNLRIAGRRDVTSLARQLARTEDKLERVLQEVERLQDELRASQASQNGAKQDKRVASQ